MIELFELTLMVEIAKDEPPGVAASLSCSTPCKLSVLLPTLVVLLTLAFLVLSSSALWGRDKTGYLEPTD